MKKVLFFITSLNGGGAEKVLLTLVNNLCQQESDYEITVHVLFGNGIYHKSLDKRIIQKSVLNHNFKHKTGEKICKYLLMKMIRFLPAQILHKMIVHKRYDIEIAYLEGMSTKIISGSSITNKYAWVHIDPSVFPYSTNAYRSFQEERKCYQKYRKVFGVSEDICRAFRKKYQLPIEVLHNVIDVDLIKKKASVDDKINMDRQCLNMVTVGRLVEQKGYDRLIKILGELKDEYNFRLYIIGEGKKEKELHELAKQCNVEDKIIWKGFLNNPYPYIKQADFFVCSSISEGYSTAVTEAIILETPVVTTNCAGMKEIFGCNNCGIITENSDNALQKALEFILKNPDHLILYEKEAKKRAQDFQIKLQLNEFKKAIFE